MIDRYGYSPENPPTSCMDCKWHQFTYLPETTIRTLWADRCDHVRRYFGVMHVILRGEYRSLSKHDEDDLKNVLPFECPYFNSSRVFWEMYGVNHMNVDIFIYDCLNHYDVYLNNYVLGIKETVDKAMEKIPPAVGLHYMYVAENDMDWFLSNYDKKTVLVTPTDPSTWVYPVPKEPV